MRRIQQKTARRALWLRGKINWKLHSGQRVIEEAYAAVAGQLFVLNCARRFGKTFWLVYKAIEVALTCPNKYPQVVIASAFRTNLIHFILPAFRAILEDCPTSIWSGWREGYNRTTFTFTFVNGASIRMVGLDKNPDGIRGNYADLILVDEARDISELKHAYSSVMGPMILNREGAKIVVSSTPPDSPAHDFSDMCVLAKAEGAYVELNIYQNPMMTPRLIKQARKSCLTESVWLREYMCQFVVDTHRALVPEWCSLKFVQPAPPPSANHDRYEAMDIGVKIDLTVVLFGYWDPTAKAVRIQGEIEINGPNMNTPILVEMIRAKERELWPELAGIDLYRRTADNSHPLLLQDMGSSHALHFVATGKDDLHAMVNEMRRAVLNGEVLIDPSCTRLIGCLESAIWNKERKAFDRSTTYGHFDHVATLMYLVRNLDRTRGLPVERATGDSIIHRQTKQLREQEKQLLAILGLNRK